MRPSLFHIFGYGVPSYAVLMALGYVAALGALFWVTPKGSKPEGGGLTRWQVWDLFIVMVISSLLGAKFGHTLFEAPGHVDQHGHAINGVWELLREDPWHWARLGEGGYVWYGGMIGALLVAVIYFRRRPRLQAWLYADAFTPAIMIGAVLGRLGCFLAGCCYGQPTESAVGVLFPGHDAPVHPTQLYDATAALVMGSFLLWRFPRRRFDGQNIALLLLCYPPLRSVTEAFRGDADRGFIGPLSTSQLLSIPLFAVGLFLYLRGAKRGVVTPPEGVSIAPSEADASAPAAAS